MKYRSLFLVWGIALCAWFAAQNSVRAQGTSFTYQGRLLSNGVAPTGSFDLQFALHPATSGTNQTGPTLTNAPVGVTNGLFTTTLDFGNVFAINPLYLEIGIRTNGSTNAYVILTPRQPITSAPYAVQALNATTAAAFTGALTDSQLSTNVPLLNGNPTFGGAVTFSNANGKFSGTFTGAASGTFSGASSGTFTGNTAGTNTGKFIGDGGLVTNINATNLIGVVLNNPNWQLVQGVAQQAVSGNNYLATNNAVTTVTLPASPTVGSTIWVSGSGSKGWVIAQPGSQSIVAAAFGLSAGQNWNTALNNSQTWHAIAASTNGTRVAAAYGTGFIYFSTDSGQTWTQSDAPSENWSDLACSADGLSMIAAPNNAVAFVYVSANGGAHWTQQTSGLPNSLLYKWVASSADGSKLVATTGSGLGNVYMSVNGGANWTTNAALSGQQWNGAASSADGTHLVVIDNGGHANVSANSGTNWSSTLQPVGPATGVTMSADGTKIAVCASFGNIYVSVDGGATWSTRASTQSWSCITSSTDGKNFAAGYNLGLIYTSSDFGQTWVPRTNGLVASGQAWSAITSSGDGSRLFATVSSGVIYNSIATTSPGSLGSLAGSQFSDVQLQYIGNNLWMPLNFTGTFTGN